MVSGIGFCGREAITQHAFANERVYGEGGRALMGLDPQSMML